MQEPTPTPAPDEARPRNAQATRNSILAAALKLFLKDGYDTAGVRAIAGEAGIDPALICRYFGSKKQLFAEVLESTSKDPMQVIAGERSSFGQRIAEALLDPEADRTQHMVFIGLVTGAGASPEARQTAREQIEDRFIVPFSAWLGGDDAAGKAWLVCSLLIGTSIMNNVSQACPESSSELGARIQAIIDS
ncbi:MAG TPA: TetR/AcrR family transcriptional regulator [Pseudomonadaceae bacterium]|nr:TetR/AcrR family transcriptional regulator [Pseudomonadaceae bacterium]